MTERNVAVIVTCFNLGRTLDEAIDSVRAQDLQPAELMVVDDGSDDLLTQQVLGSLDRSGVRVVRTPNQGVSAARNLGVRLTNSPLIALLDADDALEPTYVRKLSGALENDRDLAFVSCGMRYFGDASHLWFPQSPDLVESLTRGVVHVSSMFRRSMWTAIGGFDETMRAHEELDFWTTAVERGFHGRVLDEPLLRYRARSGSLYRFAVAPGNHLRLMQQFYEKHLPALEPRTVNLLVAKERFILEQREHANHLIEVRQRLSEQLAAVQNDIDSTVADLRAFGGSRVEFGDLDQSEPLSDDWGFDRGLPIDRHYIHQFLHEHRIDVRGRVLEVKGPDYAKAFGGDRVASIDVLDVDSLNPDATVIANLTDASSIEPDSYDSVILTQTLQLIYDVEAAIGHVHRILRPGGVLLATVPAVSRVADEEPSPDGDCWRFTANSLRRLFADAFGLDTFEITPLGNALSCTAFLYGLSAEEVEHSKRDRHDPKSPLVYGVRAVKARTEGAKRPATASAKPQGARLVLMYHRVCERAVKGLPFTITRETLRSHLEYLRDHGWRVVPLADIVTGSEDPSARVIALTFDDGYADMLTEVVPLLREFSVVATFFVVGNPNLREFWWDTLVRIFSGDTRLPSELRLSLWSEALPTRTEEEQRDAHRLLRERLYTASLADRSAAVEELVAWSGVGPPSAAAPRPLTSHELRTLAAQQEATIGAHGHDHVWLPSQPSDAKRSEILESKRRLETLLGRVVTSFSYPYGGYDDESVETARAAGFLHGVTTDSHLVRADGNPLTIPRIDVGPGDAPSFPALIGAVQSGRSTVDPVRQPRRTLVAGWFSFEEGHATAGDLLTRDLVCRWLRDAGRPYDVAVVPPFGGGVNWRGVDPAIYSDLVFVCGPFAQWTEVELLERFAGCRLVGVNLSMRLPIERWNPFDALIERDSTRASRPDLVFLTPDPTVPVVGVCRVEPYDGASVDLANRAIDRLLDGREVVRVEIDTRLDVNATGLRTPREIESLIARMDVLVTTRLHGLALALKHHVPVVAIDPEPGGAKILRQAAVLEWPAVFTVDTLDSGGLGRALDFCLSTEGRRRAQASGAIGVERLSSAKTDFLAALARPAK